MKAALFLAPILLGNLLVATLSRAAEAEADLCIYGGTSGGVIAAAQAARLGLTVIVLEPGGHLGGMTSGGLSWTDVGSSSQVTAVGGLPREFYERVGAKYGLPTGSRFGAPNGDNNIKGYDWRKPPSLAFEPKVAEAVFGELAHDPKISVYLHSRLAGVWREGTRIRQLVTEDHRVFGAKMFLDATYEGDLLARAGITFALGREANSQYGETHNGAQPPGRGRFEVPIDPYLIAGHPESGPLPYLLSSDLWNKPGSADRRIQSYNYRACLTDDPANRVPIAPPADYNPDNFELLARWTQARVAAGQKLTLRSYCKYDPLPHHKFDFNNRWPISTDYIGHADAYTEASTAERAQIAKEHENYLRGFFHFLATDPRIPANVRHEMSSFGLCRDEFPDTAGWPDQLYVREARRMVGAFVMKEDNVRGILQAPDSVGLGVYGVDSHAVRRLIFEGQPMLEVQEPAAVPHPYPIAYGSIVPRSAECENLFATFALSASHVAFASIRMEPVFMALSQSAATAAWIAIRDGVPVQQVSYSKLRKRLLTDHALLDWPGR